MSTDTTEAPVRLRCDQAARAARLLQLRRIALTYDAHRADVDTQQAGEFAAALDRVLGATRAVMARDGLDLTALPVARVVGNPVRARLAVNELAVLLWGLWADLARINHRADLAREDLAARQREAARPFDFDLDPLDPTTTDHNEEN